MEPAIRQVIESTARESAAGRITFGAVVGALLQAGVESYQVDYRLLATTYYLPDGQTLTIALQADRGAAPDSHSAPIGGAFDAAAVVAAIRGAQRDAVRYPEFKRLTMAAGCVGYIVWLQGRHVVYFGRRGETHVERFPD